MQRFTRVDQQSLSDARESYSLIGSLKQNHSQVVFEFLELATQSRLTHMTGSRGASKMSVFGNGNEVFDLLKVQARLPSHPSIDYVYCDCHNNRLYKRWRPV